MLFRSSIKPRVPVTILRSDAAARKYFGQELRRGTVRGGAVHIDEPVTFADGNKVVKGLSFCGTPRFFQPYRTALCEQLSATAGIFNVADLCSAVYFGIRHKSVGAGYETSLNDIFIVHDITRNKTVSESGCVFGILFLSAKHLKAQSDPTNRAGQSYRPALSFLIFYCIAEVS